MDVPLTGLFAALLYIFIRYAFPLVKLLRPSPSYVPSTLETSDKMQSDHAVLQLPNEATLAQEESTLVIKSTARPSRTCLGLLSQGQATENVPFANILSARVDSRDSLILTYAKPISKTKVQLTKRSFNESHKVERKVLEQWATALEEKAWENGRVQRNLRIMVLINPAGGTGSAQKYYLRDIKPILEAAGCTIDEQYTSHKGHAVDITRDMNVFDYDVIACCSGDGLPHEVFNGLGKRDDARLALAKLAVVQLPCGSGNAMSWNCFGTASPTLATLRFTKSVRMPLDLVSLTQLDPEINEVTRTLSFLSQSVGIIADIDLGTENMRWVGSKRFELGFFIRIMRKTIYPCDIAVAATYETKEEIRKFHMAETRKKELLEPERLTAALKEYELREGDPEHLDYAGLPRLEYGTVTDPLPTGWQQTPFDNLGNFYSGNMTIMAADTPFFPAALPSDGFNDLVTIRGDVSRSAALDIATKVPEYKLFDHAEVQYRKITGYRIRPKAQSGYISIDGEPMRHAEYQAEIHKALGTTMSLSGKRFEAKDIQ